MCMYLSPSPPLPGGRLVLNAAEDLAGLFVTAVGGGNALKENKAAVFLSQLLLFFPTDVGDPGSGCSTGATFTISFRRVSVFSSEEEPTRLMFGGCERRCGSV